MITNWGPFLDVRDCGRVLASYSRGSLPDSDYEELKTGRARDQGAEDRVLRDVQRGTRGASCRTAPKDFARRPGPKRTPRAIL